MANKYGVGGKILKFGKDLTQKAKDALATKKAAPATKKAAPPLKVIGTGTLNPASATKNAASASVKKKVAKVAAIAGAGVGVGAGAGYLAGRNSDKKAAPPAPPKATTKSKDPIVTKKQLEDSGFTNLRDYMNDKKGLTRRDGKAPERKGEAPAPKPGNESNAPKPDYTPTKTDAKTEDSRSKMQKLFGASEEKRAMGRNLQDNARKSMGMKKGGKVHKMPDGTKMKGAKHGMKHGGAVKAKSIDGIAVRGKTRCK
jgi:hypothetical protein